MHAAVATGVPPVQPAGAVMRAAGAVEGLPAPPHAVRHHACSHKLATAAVVKLRRARGRGGGVHVSTGHERHGSRCGLYLLIP